tara:strand:+ start:361 stop:681 length:321 start_codon:yes stop_codon:yes gene_type:complete
MNFFLILSLILAVSFLNIKYFPKLNLTKKLNNFINSLRNLKSEKEDYTKILDNISLKGLILIISFLSIMVPWTLIFIVNILLGINQFLSFIIATIPYLTLIKFWKK